jgi:hypothetical protein
VAGDAVYGLLFIFLHSAYLHQPAARFHSLEFPGVSDCYCLSLRPMIDHGSATLTNVSSSVTPTILNESMPLGAHAMLESPSPFLHHKPPGYFVASHVNQILGSNSFLGSLLAP